MIKVLMATAILAGILSIPTGAQAQSIGTQNQNSLQTPTSTQSTQSLQTQDSRLQQNNSTTTLSDTPPDSLGVVGNPNQSQPSVSVGKTNSSTAGPERGDSISLWITIPLGIIVVSMLFLYARRYNHLRKVANTERPETAQTDPVRQTKLPAKDPALTSDLTEPKKVDSETSKKAKTTKKSTLKGKKKKKHHR